MIQNFLIDISTKYDLVGLLGSGSYGSVYKYKNRDTDIIYAAKVSKNECISTEQQKNFFTEVVTLSKATNPAILPFYGFNLRGLQMAPNPTIILKYLPKGSLEKVLQLEPDLQLSKRYLILLGIAEGMKYLHSIKIAHRDLKPGNILIGDDYHPYISDFGQSKITETNLEQILMKTPTGSIICMAPEVMSNQSYTYKADVYSFSLIAYQLITGRIPFNNIKPSLFVTCILNGQRPDISIISEEYIQELLSKWWSGDPHERPTFKEIINEITDERFLRYMEANDEEISEYLSLFGDKLNNNNDIDNISNLEQEANNGNIESILRYADILKRGEGIPVDLEKSEHYYKIASERGNNIGIYNYAQLLLRRCNFSEVDQDDIENNLKETSNKGDPNNSLIYANNLYNGDSQEEQIQISSRYYKISADNGNPTSMNIYARMLYDGDGLPPNRIESARYFKMSADLGNSNSQFKYGEMLYEGD